MRNRKEAVTELCFQNSPRLKAFYPSHHTEKAGKLHPLKFFLLFAKKDWTISLSYYQISSKTIK